MPSAIHDWETCHCGLPCGVEVAVVPTLGERFQKRSISDFGPGTLSNWTLSRVVNAAVGVGEAGNASTSARVKEEVEDKSPDSAQAHTPCAPDAKFVGRREGEEHQEKTERRRSSSAKGSRDREQRQDDSSCRSRRRQRKRSQKSSSPSIELNTSGHRREKSRTAAKGTC